MKSINYLVVIGLHLIFVPSLAAQERTADTENHSRHRIAVVLGHTHVSQGISDDGDKTWLVL